jgi:hypothetical protein
LPARVLADIADDILRQDKNGPAAAISVMMGR